MKKILKRRHRIEPTEQNIDGSLGKSVDLMKKLSDYLGY